MRTVTGVGRASGRGLRNERGQSVVEYALILAGASVGIAIALLILRDSLGGTLAGTSARIDAAATLNAPTIPGDPGGGVTAGQPSGGDDDGGGHGNGQHGNGKGNSGNGNGNGGPNGRKN